MKLVKEVVVLECSAWISKETVTFRSLGLVVFIISSFDDGSALIYTSNMLGTIAQMKRKKHLMKSWFDSLESVRIYL